MAEAGGEDDVVKPPLPYGDSVHTVRNCRQVL